MKVVGSIVKVVVITIGQLKMLIHGLPHTTWAQSQKDSMLLFQ